ncbi:MAG: hypothetical protein FWH42_05995, partial [Dehalococcoidia bacterium]|nr:hypothetical protein [Dehalococcoidia bacterium]
AWEGFLKIGKSIDIFKENPDNPWPGIGMIFSGLGDWFAGFFNTVLSWFGWPSTKVEGSIVFSSDAEMAEPDSSSSSSPPGGGVSYAPSGSVLINTRYVRLFHNRFATDYYLGYPNLATLFRFQTILRAKVDLKKSSWNTIKWTYPDTNIKKLLETNSPNGRGGHGEITLYVTKEALSHVTAEVMKDGKSTGITDKIPVVGITQVEHQNKVLQTSKAVTLLPSQASVADKRTYG